MATVIAIAAHEAVWMLPKKDPAPPAEKTLIQRHIEHVASQRRRVQVAESWGDMDW